MLEKFAKLVLKLIWFVSLGKEEQPGRDRAEAHVSYIRRYSKVNDLIEKSARLYISIAEKDGPSVHNEEYSILMQRSIAHKAKAQEMLQSLDRMMFKKKFDEDDKRRCNEMMQEFAASVVGLELVFNALSAMVQRVKEG
jgi:hypothetical protein